MSEEEIINILSDEIVSLNVGHEKYEQAVKGLLDLYEKEKEKNKELEKEKETNQQMIYLAETQILGYGQGYKDGLNKETTATEIVARERENQIIYEGMKHKLNMEWVLKIKAKIEEVDYKMIAHQDVREAVKQVLESLLEKE